MILYGSVLLMIMMLVMYFVLPLAGIIIFCPFCLCPGYLNMVPLPTL